MKSLRTMLAAVLVTALVTPAAIPANPAVAEDTQTPPWYATQQLQWQPCNKGQCATMEVPTDWANPDGERVTLTLATADLSTAVKPVLLVNPGGPGASGIDLALNSVDAFSKEVRQHYRIVGFDPRGVGKSTPIRCVTSTKQMDQFLTATYPFTTKGRQNAVKAAKAFAQRCKQLTGSLLGHVDSVSVVRDMDAMRAVLGQEKLNFFGFSYGTKLATLYAELFPDRVGRLVLDGPMDISKSSDVSSQNQLKGFSSAFRAFAKYCANRKSCKAGNTVKKVETKVGNMLIQLAKKPLKTNQGRKLGQAWGFTGVIMALYSKEFWPYLERALNEAITAKNGSVLMILADAYFGRENGKYTANDTEANLAINCLDYGGKNKTLAQAKTKLRTATKMSPALGPLWADNGINICAYWPYKQNNKPHIASSATSAPILIVGTTGDPATPYAEAKALTKQLKTSRLLTFQGEGHTAYSATGNACIVRTVDAYLIKGTLPAAGRICK